MALTVAGVQKFLDVTVSLPSFPLFCIYLVMIMLSPVWQRVTSPMQIRPLMIIHNFACCFISIYCMLGFLYSIMLSESTFQLGPQPYLLPYYKMYWITKVIELLDTVFMILRHRRRQISFLHVYHHSSMLLLADSCYRLYPWPAMSVYFAVNSFIHVILYLYYGLTALFPDKSIPWKKNITQLQILQFLTLFVHATFGYLYHNYCVYGLLYGITMTTLFSNFYYAAYVKSKPEKSRKCE
ncbi:very long chain fatty acid elongase 1-like [Mytilus galloprovincialis]|uniref:very long chain fatty acid elongase 1-like n=1 Tax=Mytilus galloprovincialis TaxID=29158 RepID=UPI003F7B54C8